MVSTHKFYSQQHQDTDIFILKDGNFSHLGNYRDNKAFLSDEKINKNLNNLSSSPNMLHQQQRHQQKRQLPQMRNDSNEGVSLNFLSSGVLGSDNQKTQYKTFSLTNKQELKQTTATAAAESVSIGQSNSTFSKYNKKYVRDRKISDNLSKKLGFLTSSINGAIGSCPDNTNEIDSQVIEFNLSKSNFNKRERRQKPQKEQKEEIMSYFNNYKSKFINKNGINYGIARSGQPSTLLQSRPSSQRRSDLLAGHSTTVMGIENGLNSNLLSNENIQENRITYGSQINEVFSASQLDDIYKQSMNFIGGGDQRVKDQIKPQGFHQHRIASYDQYMTQEQNSKISNFENQENSQSNTQSKKGGIYIMINENGNFSHRESISQEILNKFEKAGLQSQKSIQNHAESDSDLKLGQILPQILSEQDPLMSNQKINQGEIIMYPTESFALNEQKLIQMTNFSQMAHSSILEPKHQQMQSHNVFKKLIGNISATQATGNPKREVVSQAFKKHREPDPIQVYKEEQKNQIRQRQQSSNPRASSKYFNMQKKGSSTSAANNNSSYYAYGKRDDSTGSYRKRRSSIKKDEPTQKQSGKNQLVGSQKSFIVAEPIQKISNLSSSNWYIVPQPNQKDKNLQVLPIPKKMNSSNEVQKKRLDYQQSQQFRNIAKTSSQSFYSKNQASKSPQQMISKQHENIKDLECFLEVQKMALLKQSPNILYNKIRTENFSLQEQYKSSVSPDTTMIAPNYNKYYAHDYDLNQIIQKQIIRGDIQIAQKQLKFVVIPGNNSQLIKDAMLRRSYLWRETTANDQAYSFKWQPVSYGIRFEQIGQFSILNFMSQKQLVNHLEYHSQLSEKSKLFINMSKFAMKLKENVFNYIPITFFIEVDSMNLKQFNMQLTQFNGFYYTLEDSKKKVLKFWTKYQKYLKKQSEQESQTNLDEQSPRNNNTPQSVVDQMILNIFGTNRKNSNKNLVKEEQTTITFDINNKKSNQKYMMPISHFTGHNLWLLKPTKLNRGRGIHVCNNISTLKDLMHKYCEGFKKKSITLGSTVAGEKLVTSQKSPLPQSPNKICIENESEEQKQAQIIMSAHSLTPIKNEDPITEMDPIKTHTASAAQAMNSVEPQSQQQRTPNQNSKQIPRQVKIKHNSFIIQKYIERPLLIYERKFDIRVWVFMNYDGCVYMFKEGYLRTSSSKFSIDPNNPDDQFVHLTNNAIQKYSDNYGSFEDGNQMSYDQFQEYLDQYVFDSDSSKILVKEEIVFKFKQLIMRSIFATRKQLDPNHRKSCFELFGYDFIMDEDFNVWLIEVNTNPCIEESSNILKIYLPRMIDDMIKLSVDQHFQDAFQIYREPPNLNLPSFPVKGYEDDENMWEYLVNVRDRTSRKEASRLYLKPIEQRSKFGFQIKNRKLKVRRYNSKVGNGLVGQIMTNGVVGQGNQNFGNQMIDYEKLLVQSNII
ncbi:tubulin-tyrosine ligase family protein [Stylonychia lemnae]|uniref:Tubulin-tyrosine ligase family protein n=1 Tax=Stylonychia lemnae TaxID=5949 RepID=A0A077ZW75_STYLE|nr:tubulin-tyrosine ligase family protein [Stylonychia lemnae]|eukprot:CDW72701.1 tubulin-tyrosine ligase family protein [Stylonychia lemnae]